MFKLIYLKKNYFLSPLNLFLSIGVLLITLACIDNSGDNNITFFGGKIKNPKGEYVYFSKNGKYLDSARIDSNNKFSFHLDAIELGLYVFHHGPEIQFLYLEPKDSLLIYLNTWDFDESLIFSGTQGSKNNYLIKLWLDQEKFEINFKYNYRLDEKEFSNIIDDEINRQLIIYNQFIENEGEEPSEFFDKLAKTGIYFPLYTLKEAYPSKNKRALKLKALPELNEDFYGYRNAINLNDQTLISYWPYTVYIEEYLENKTFYEYYTNPEKNNFSLNFMKIVTEEINLEGYKNTLLEKSLWHCLVRDHLSDDEFLKVNAFFLENCTNEKIREEIQKSIEQKIQLKHGHPLPQIVALNTNGNQTIINDLAKNKDVVIYFWPKDLASIEYIINKLAKLKKKYPEILFIGIERNKSSEDWIKFVETKKLPKDNQFRILKNSDAYSYFEGDMERTVILNQDGNVHSGYLFFLSHNFDMQLKKINKH